MHWRSGRPVRLDPNLRMYQFAYDPPRPNLALAEEYGGLTQSKDLGYTTSSSSLNMESYLSGQTDRHGDASHQVSGHSLNLERSLPGPTASHNISQHSHANSSLRVSRRERKRFDHAPSVKDYFEGELLEAVPYEPRENDIRSVELDGAEIV